MKNYNIINTIIKFPRLIWLMLITFIFGLSVALVPLVFSYAKLQRGYDAIGGEVFTIMIPLLVLWVGYNYLFRRLN